MGAGAHVVELFGPRGDGQVEIAEAKCETFSWYLASCFFNVEILTSITQGMHEPRRRTIYLQNGMVVQLTKYDVSQHSAHVL